MQIQFICIHSTKILTCDLTPFKLTEDIVIKSTRICSSFQTNNQFGKPTEKQNHLRKIHYGGQSMNLMHLATFFCKYNTLESKSLSLLHPNSIHYWFYGWLRLPHKASQHFSQKPQPSVRQWRPFANDYEANSHKSQ